LRGSCRDRDQAWETTITHNILELSQRHSRDPAETIAADEQHFRAVAECLKHSVTELSDQLDAARLTAAGSGQRAMDRDLEVRRLTARLRVLRRFDLDICLGRVVTEEDADPVYIGRIGIGDAAGRRLLVDWRTPVAEPFFAATLGTPMGLLSRRRYRWARGRLTDYWDEVFDLDAAQGAVTLDDDCALMASLGSSRSPRMRSVLSTIQADQDAVIRESSRGALVVDGGPGTGKTVIALHRAAYLLYADPHLDRGGSSIQFVGPNENYLAYVADILPSLGEDSVQTCTLGELVPEGRTATPEQNIESGLLKSSTDLLTAIDRAVGSYEVPPSNPLTIETPWLEIQVTAREWGEAFSAADPACPHNDARAEVWEALLDILTDQSDSAKVEPGVLRRYIARDEELNGTFQRAWPLLDPAGVVADLLSVPDFLRRCAPWLSSEHAAVLRRADGRNWTVADLPILDAARHRIGSPETSRRRRRREAALAVEHEVRDRVVDDLIASDDSELRVMSMLQGQDARNSLIDEAGLPDIEPGTLAGPYAHIFVDEAQELTDAEWKMLLRRCPSRSFTVVGDRAQARRGFTESWHQRLERVGLAHIRQTSLTINYRTPEEVMAEAEPVIRAVLPDANVPISVRNSGIPVLHRSTSDLELILNAWLDTHDEGTACVIGHPTFTGTSRVRSLSPEDSKGLEFDFVVLVNPARLGSDVQGAVDRYVAMTRATRQLVILDDGISTASSPRS
jgi:hypothetical protein